MNKEKPDALRYLVTQDGYQLGFRLDGPDDAEQSVLLIGGLGDNHGSWDAQVPTLEGLGLRVIRGDNRCADKRSACPEELSIIRMADDWIEVLDSLRIESAIVAGTSMGGMIAQALAERHPERVEAMIFIATVPRLPKIARLTLGLWHDLLETGPTGLERVLFDGCLHGFSGDWLEENGDRISNWVSPTQQSAAALSAQIDALLAFEPVDSLPRVPALIVNGRSDMLFPLSVAREFLGLCPQATIEVIECGHAIAIERPDALNQAISQFLRKEFPDG